MFDNLQNSLIPLGQLSDENFQVVLNKMKLYAFKNEKKLQGNISGSGNGLWGIPITRQNKSTSLKSQMEAAAKKQTPSP